MSDSPTRSPKSQETGPSRAGQKSSPSAEKRQPALLGQRSNPTSPTKSGNRSRCYGSGSQPKQQPSLQQPSLQLKVTMSQTQSKQTTPPAASPQSPPKNTKVPAMGTVSGPAGKCYGVTNDVVHESFPRSSSINFPIEQHESISSGNECLKQCNSPTKSVMSAGDRRSPSGSASRELRSSIAAKKEKLARQGFEGVEMVNEYSVVEQQAAKIRRPTAIIYDEKCCNHFCTWDKKHPEKPERYLAIMSRLFERRQNHRWVRLDSAIDDISQLALRVHTPEHWNLLMESAKNIPENLEKLSSEYDSIYINRDTADCAISAVANTYKIARDVAMGKYQNGFAVVRPPGHHACHDAFNGYCFLNNVAITADALTSLEKVVKRLMIIDFDVHHGQGIQQKFYDRDDVLYLSIHRYEEGKFWPNLRQSHFDFIGRPKSVGEGYNINIPLNETGCTDSDYLAILLNIILPIAYEYAPELVLFSAGYDACIGCPEGEMLVTPSFYGHMMKLLSGVAEGRLVAVLEGGYFVPSLAEGAAQTMAALLDDPCGDLDLDKPVKQATIDTINCVRVVLQEHWQCMRDSRMNIADVNPGSVAGSSQQEQCVWGSFRAELSFVGGDLLTKPFPTRDYYLVLNKDRAEHFAAAINQMKSINNKLENNGVCYSYRTEMGLHECESEHPEGPDRLDAVLDILKEWKLNDRISYVASDDDESEATLRIAHSKRYIEMLLGSDPSRFAGKMYPKFIHKLCSPVKDDDDCEERDNAASGLAESSDLASEVYWSQSSAQAIRAEVRVIMDVVDAVMTDKYTAGVAVVRPPGHHADTSNAGGFCFVNNVVVMAELLLRDYKKERILIVDFDIHHGNGTQSMTYNSSNVCYISLHKYEGGKYYPRSTCADYTYVGEGAGTGYNVNIPFNHDRMDNSDYLAAFHRIVLPVAYTYRPQVVIVSAGFDAGINDRLGNYRITPEAFGHFVQLLRPLANGKMFLVMEGGYNLTTLKYGMAMCVKALLGDPLPPIDTRMGVKDSTMETILNVVRVHGQHWPLLTVARPLPRTLQKVTLSTPGACETFSISKGVSTAMNATDVIGKLYSEELGGVAVYQAAQLPRK